MKTIGVIGLGYVGLPLALMFHSKGFPVVGIDIDPDKLALYHKGRSYLSTIEDKVITELKMSDRFTFSDDYSLINKVDVIIICVPTPLSEKEEPELVYIFSALSSMLPYLKKDHLIVLESSTYPGTTEDEIVSFLQRNGWAPGEDILVGYSPERIDPGNTTHAHQDIPKIISGINDQSLNEIHAVYEQIFNTLIPVSTPRVAEITKLVENTQRFINISFINEISKLCHELDIDIWEVIAAAGTKPYGFTPYYPSSGIGGHCIPVDPLYLKWKADQHNFKLNFVEIAKKVNDIQPSYIVQRVNELMKQTNQSEAGGILVVGLTYKPNVNDLRESRPLKVFELLQNQHDQVYFYDPYVKEFTLNGEVHSSQNLDRLEHYELVLILSDHDKINYEKILQSAKLIFDTKNCYKKNYPNVKRL
ncbi:nucleotide sugar dehydrogenase [Alkalihalophilus marmarensis]|uniref:UDP-glucose/GDP-mannose dehydrogenase C-terminal domain-containing protein n=1 Tax=Alkalihalophilus marmarensis DSM 21297 TaxID=1188261 RepID=U6SNC8_9BACI|nr:nucleotide sugar dehydrogenase [Alkalihalophilus marmarensis]ERN52862.1 hypothetical protein A33I_14360 [Alkalihalophilus marmarensis DSM 21297]MCM3489117.1 nucleotide sugar dehydrogenase [Alkalihalophilus marmarensis]